jgi:hypothetical protein
MWRLRPVVILGAVWAVVAVWLARRRLAHDGVHARVPWPIGLPSSSTPGVTAVLNRLAPTCLERSLVAQTWRAAHGDPRDLVIGIPLAGMKNAPAHAWLDGAAVEGHSELHRMPPPTRRRSAF